MRIPTRELSTADLAAQTSLKLTEVSRQYMGLQGHVYTCRLDGQVMLLTEARKIIEQRIADNERKQGQPTS